MLVDYPKEWEKYMFEKELKFKKLPTFVMKIICMIDICKFLLIRDSSATIRTAERKNFLRPDIS